MTTPPTPALLASQLVAYAQDGTLHYAKTFSGKQVIVAKGRAVDMLQAAQVPLTEAGMGSYHVAADALKQALGDVFMQKLEEQLAASAANVRGRVASSVFHGYGVAGHLTL